mmetsp:Transcript_1277/g.3845  ORF Transcript_1277/g.3845 Transcript_1277/m.3845 type:complete len:181 (-) Transcript_1277:379-921(-)
MPKKKKQTADPAKRSNGRATSVIITAAGQTARARWEAIQSQAEAHQIVWLGEKVAAAALKEARAVQRRELEEQRRTLQLSLRETRPPGAGGTDGGGNGGAATPVLSQQAPETTTHLEELLADCLSAQLQEAVETHSFGLDQVGGLSVFRTKIRMLAAAAEANLSDPTSEWALRLHWPMFC